MRLLNAVLALVLCADFAFADVCETKTLMPLFTSFQASKLCAWVQEDLEGREFNGINVDKSGNSSRPGNTAVGDNVLRSLATATNDLSLGNPPQSIAANTSGTENTGLGTEALKNALYSSDNTCLGSRSCRDQTSTYYNTAVGHYALGFNTVGWKNTAVGAFTMNGLSEGNSAPQENTAVGYGALAQASTAQYNTAIGNATLTLNRTGIRNTAVGDSALASTVTGGDGNTGIGQSALYEVTTGDYNVAIGYETGRGITTGSGNVVLGPNVSGLSASLANNIIIASGGGIKAQHDATDWAMTGGLSATLGFRPPSLSDAAAANNTIYYSTTASKLVYKDGAGVVNALY